MVRLTPFFRDVPEQNLREMLKVSEPLRVRDADVIVRDGEEGDYYYMVLDGMASVIRRRTPDEEPRVAAVLAPGFAFGEEALISNARRNATVIMETHGILLRIPKNAFLDHIVASLVTTITPGEANRMIGEGAKWLDVFPADRGASRATRRTRSFSHLHLLLRKRPLERCRRVPHAPRRLQGRSPPGRPAPAGTALQGITNGPRTSCCCTPPAPPPPKQDSADARTFNKRACYSMWFC